MDQFFSFPRFGLLVAKHLADNKKRYGFTILAFIGLMIAWFIFTILIEVDNPMSKDIQQITFFLWLFATGAFYASQYFRDLGSRAKGGPFLLVPASAFEKLLCSLLFTVVLYFVVFVAVFYLADALMVKVSGTFSSMGGDAVKPRVVDIFKLSSLPFNYDSTINLILLFFGAQAAFLLGSIYFEKYSFVKTVVCGFMACLICLAILFVFFEKVLPDGDYNKGFLSSYRVFVKDGPDLLIQLPDWIGKTLRFVIMYAIAPFLWVVTYVRLKEKQV